MRSMISSLALQQIKMRLEASKAVTNFWLTFEQKVEGREATVDKEINIEHEKNDYNHFFLLKDGDMSGIAFLRLLRLGFMKRIASFLQWMDCFYLYLLFTIHCLKVNLQ